MIRRRAVPNPDNLSALANKMAVTRIASHSAPISIRAGPILCRAKKIAHQEKFSASWRAEAAISALVSAPVTRHDPPGRKAHDDIKRGPHRREQPVRRGKGWAVQGRIPGGDVGLGGEAGQAPTPASAEEDIKRAAFAGAVFGREQAHRSATRDPPGPTQCGRHLLGGGDVRGIRWGRGRWSGGPARR